MTSVDFLNIFSKLFGRLACGCSFSVSGFNTLALISKSFGLVDLILFLVDLVGEEALSGLFSSCC